jgi:predicted GIY-YIG superfamily endonuclease
MIYYGHFQMIGDAMGREKEIKASYRVAKNALPVSINPR